MHSFKFYSHHKARLICIIIYYIEYKDKLLKGGVLKTDTLRIQKLERRLHSVLHNDRAI